jgi:ABC-type cobalamin transport system ATPase subunit
MKKLWLYGLALEVRMRVLHFRPRGSGGVLLLRDSLTASANETMRGNWQRLRCAASTKRNRRSPDIDQPD